MVPFGSTEIDSKGVLVVGIDWFCVLVEAPVLVAVLSTGAWDDMLTDYRVMRRQEK